MGKPKSKAQARLFGAVAGGKKTKAHGMTPAEAKKRMEGVDMSKLPAKKKKKKR